jgi:hypothetical protein
MLDGKMGNPDENYLQSEQDIFAFIKKKFCERPGTWVPLF